MIYFCCVSYIISFPMLNSGAAMERLQSSTIGIAASNLERLPLTALRPWPRNARTHSKKQVRQIADSIRRFGFTNPVLIDSDNTILAGHGRVAAAKLLGMDEVPCLRLERMSAAEKRAYVLADNKLALNAGWDEEILAEELKDLLALDLDFDIGLTGFSIPEIDSLIEGLSPEEPGAPEEDIIPGDGPVRCRPGDLWQLGPHRLICGNALDPVTVAALLGAERAQMVFTDPPYNVPVHGHVGGLGSIKHREFAMAAGEMTAAEFTAFLRTAFERLIEASLDGSIHFICMDWRHMGEMLAAGEGRLCRAQEPDRLGQGQRRHGDLLPLPPRADLRLQERHGAAHQQLRARPARALPHERVDVSRRQHACAPGAWRSWRCIRPSSRCS